jgi:Chromo (CHRromatin Organisation MOdifier) domain
MSVAEKYSRQHAAAGVARAGNIEYLVEWEGYPSTQDYTWEPVQQLREDVPEMVAAFETVRKRRQ